MIKLYFVAFTTMVLSAKTYGQIGINTGNPKGTFHIDGKKDNAVSGNITEAQIKNDVVITTDGDMGIGTLTPMAKVDINTTNSGLLLPRLTNAQRNTIPVGRAQGGTIIYNIEVSKIQVNSGTDTNRIWLDLESPSPTKNTSVVFEKQSSQTIYQPSNNVPVTFDNTIFDNTPPGFIVKSSNNSDVILTPGKIYKVEASLGSINFNDANGGVCHILDRSSITSTVLRTFLVLPTSYSAKNYNSFNTAMGFINAKARPSNTTISLVCAKSKTGSLYWEGTSFARLSVTIMD